METMNRTMTQLGVGLAFLVLLPVHWWYITAVCMSHPTAAFIPGAALLCVSPLAYSCRRTKRIRSVVLTVLVAAGWLAYAVWEQKMFRTFSPLDVPIRVDLLGILPLLWFGSGGILNVFIEELAFASGRNGQQPSPRDSSKAADGLTGTRDS